MKRRNFLKGLLGLITLPVVVKASITEEINNSLLEIAQYEPMIATEVLNRQEEWENELNKIFNKWKINTDDIITMSDMKDLDGSLTKFRLQ